VRAIRAEWVSDPSAFVVSLPLVIPGVEDNRLINLMRPVEARREPMEAKHLKNILATTKSAVSIHGLPQFLRMVG